jgi:hypothetical protein
LKVSFHSPGFLERHEGRFHVYACEDGGTAATVCSPVSAVTVG